MELSVYISNERIEIVAGTGAKSKAKIKKVYSKCNVLIALSEEWKERLSQIVPEDRIEIIENYSVLHEDPVKFFGCIGIQINSIINVIRFINIGSKQRKLC